MQDHIYAAIDLKSFYASVECIERGLDPLTTNLVVADESRTEKTICLAVTSCLKAHGIKGRPRLFEVIQKVREVNSLRRRCAPNHVLSGESTDDAKLRTTPNLALAYITAVPRMALYIDYSTRIYNVYLKYISPEDIHAYSIDEVFIDVTSYLGIYGQSPRELVMTMLQDILKTTGITATAGIGTNIYLSKVAMDIGAKKIPPDENGVRIAELDEHAYRRMLWAHRPLTDFWRIGKGYAKKLETYGLMTMGDIARCSLHNESLLYRLFGVNAELLIDHAWGWEPCTIADIKAYKPKSNSIGSGQVLQCPYEFEKARLVAKEMADLLSLDLVEKKLVSNQLVLTVGYDSLNMEDSEIPNSYQGEIVINHYGKKIPKHAHGTVNLNEYTASSKLFIAAILDLFDRIVNKHLLVHRLNLVANNIISESKTKSFTKKEQLSLLIDYSAPPKKEKKSLESQQEKNRQEVIVAIRNRYGKNAILKGMNLVEGATTPTRNILIGGHKA